jgi:beta-ureidopropionase / N-carbamoyl-L-amino-acid hydrolase
MLSLNRREFVILAFGSFAANTRATPHPSSVTVNGARLNDHLTALSRFGANPKGGVSRLAYSQADIDAREAVASWMREAALAVRFDAAANIVGHRKGTEPSARPIVFGSHIDSVPDAGNFDGNVGSMAAIEVAQTLADRGLVTRHPVEVVIWSNEEGGLYGSRAWSGQLTPEDLAQTSGSGVRIDEGMRRIGGDPARLGEVKRAPGDIAAYFELHVEQGGILDAARIDIGIVEGIVGIREWEVTIGGVANHAGTTPMDRRHDALLTAARFVELVNRIVRSEPGSQVGTVGRIQAWPGAPNVIPGRVVCTLELRDLDDGTIARLYDRIREESAALGALNGTTFEFASREVNVSARTDPRLRAIVGASAEALGLSTRVMPSGAGHDAQSMARLGPMAMIFIPSAGGISHSPREFSTPGDIVNGANVLLRSVLAADRMP